jgi:hypothetical protein
MIRSLATLSLFLLPALGTASPIILVPNAGHGANPFPGALNNSGTPFWNQPSLDVDIPGTNPGLNVGNYLTSQGSFQPGSGSPFQNIGLGLSPGNLTTITSAGSQAMPAPALIFGFGANPASDVQMSLTLTISDTSSTNIIGWYPAGNPSSLNPLFTGAETLGVPIDATFAPGGDFGLYLQLADGQVFLSGTTDPMGQRFALFIDSAGKFFIGLEDLPFGSGEGFGDFNDAVFSLQGIGPPPGEPFLFDLPEPGSLALLGVGLAGLAFYRLRRKRVAAA